VSAGERIAEIVLSLPWGTCNPIPGECRITVGSARRNHLRWTAAPGSFQHPLGAALIVSWYGQIAGSKASFFAFKGRGNPAAAKARACESASRFAAVKLRWAPAMLSRIAFAVINSGGYIVLPEPTIGQWNG